MQETRDKDVLRMHFKQRQDVYAYLLGDLVEALTLTLTVTRTRTLTLTPTLTLTLTRT